MNDRIFQSSEARNRIAQWYEIFLARIPGPVEHRQIETSLGASHVLLAGDTTKPPLVCLHGALASSAHLVSEMGPLLERFHILAPDVPGQSVRGPQVRPSPTGDSHPRWLLEVLDGLQVESCAIYGGSWGAHIALQTALYAPARVKHLVLLVPAGFVGGFSWEAFSRAALPVLFYRLSSSPTQLRRFLRALLSTPDAQWTGYMADALRDYALHSTLPPLFQAHDLADFQVPTLILAAAKDISFPGEKLLARASEIFPQAQTHLLTESRHIPPFTDEFRRDIADRISEFLE